jgi:hypothetical protein
VFEDFSGVALFFRDLLTKKFGKTVVMMDFTPKAMAR